MRQCRIAELRNREVINITDGARLGFVEDVLIDIQSGSIKALVVPGPPRIFGLFGREDDYILPWENISRMGEDIILVEVVGEYRRGKIEKRKNII
ncbi:MAG: YlmC/YmxH family sporulation protein [Clostridiales bacterium]|nr:YlmC/YmxH family sporulation protein [Clostridiales bacterium]